MDRPENKGSWVVLYDHFVNKSTDDHENQARKYQSFIGTGTVQDILKGIKQVINIYPKQKGKGNKKERKTRRLTKIDEIQEKLFELFKMNDYITI